MRPLLALVLSLSCLFAEDPSVFRGTPSHLGVFKVDRSPSLSSVKWAFKTGARILSSPAVHGDVVYFGSADHHLYAVGAQDGALRWKYRAKGAVNASPAVDGNLVFFGSDDGGFSAVEVATGKRKWHFETEGERRFSAPGIHGARPRTEVMPDPFDVFLSSPLVAGGRVYFGSGDHHVYALEAATGKLVWRFKTGNVVHASPALADGALFIGSWDRYLYALDATTGAPLWKFETGDDRDIFNQVGIASSAAVAGGIVYFGCRDGHFYAVDAKTGALRWSHDNHKGWVIASPAVHQDRVYFPTSDGKRFKALDALNGKVVFDLENEAISFSSPAIAGGLVYFGTSDGWFHAVDIKTGKMRAQFRTEGSRQHAAAFTNASGKLDFGSMYPDHTLDGMILGLHRMFSLGSILSSPVLAEDTVYFGSTDGHLYALK